ncbi:replication initiator protein RctB domain-containing protein [Enterovibrio norvegicus]|uniref:replication initiator protein RctB domain-containing protein n=1 Tax=Enterovibrio norvegicus TaxID=188144 RepID=UPI00352DCCDB
MNESVLSFANRTAADGSFFYFEGDTVYDLDILDSIPTTARTLTPTLKMVCEQSCNTDSEQTVSTSQIADALGITMNSLNHRLRKMACLGLIRELPFEFSTTRLKKRVKCYTIVTGEDAAKCLSNSDNKRDRSAESNNRQLAKQQLMSMGLDNRVDYRKNAVPTPVRHRESNIIEQLVVPSKQRRQKLVKSFTVNTDKERSAIVAADVYSRSRIVDADDLQVLYAIYTLIYYYHEAAIHQHLDNSTLPKNLTPIYVDDILTIQRKAKGGSSRGKAKDSIHALTNTTYNLVGLAEVPFSDESLRWYTSKAYSVFKQCNPLTNEAPEVIDGDLVFGQSAMIYLIELPDHIFTSLMTHTALFTFPKNSLRVDSLVFMFYLRFRSLVNGRRRYQEKIRTTLLKAFNPMQKPHQFVRQIIKSFRQLNSFEDAHLSCEWIEEQEMLRFNLWGYHGVLSYSEGEDLLSVVPDYAEIARACELDPDRQKAPTTRNDIAASLYSAMKIERILPKNLSRVIESQISRYHVFYPAKTTDSVDCILAKASSSSEIDSAVATLSADYGVEPYFVRAKVEKDLSGLNAFVINGNEFTQDDFDFIRGASGCYGLSTVDIINGFVRKRSKHDQLISIVFNEQQPTEDWISLVKSFACNDQDFG